MCPKRGESSGKYEELEQQVMEIRRRPLMMICRTPNGKERPMTVRECATTGSTYIHVAADELDELLARELGGK